MIGCDVSSGEDLCPGNLWYHYSCINLNLLEVSNIEKYICNACSLRTKEKTQLKNQNILTEIPQNEQVNEHQSTQPEEEEDELFTVKAIHDHGQCEENPSRTKFLVEWEDYPNKDDFTWEFEDKMEQCYDIISKYRATKKLPRTKLVPIEGAISTGKATKHNTYNWTDLKTMKQVAQHYLKYSKFNTDLKLIVSHLDNLKKPSQDSIIIALLLNHYYAILYISKSNTAFITDGKNEIFQKDIEATFQRKLGANINKIEMNRQFKIDHCASAALLGALELIKHYNKKDLLIMDLTLPGSWMERIISQLHKGESKSEPTKKDMRQVSRFLTCKFCNNFKTMKGKVALANHERTCKST